MRLGGNARMNIARVTLAFIFIYHGLVPKLLTQDPIEIAMSHQLAVWLAPYVHLSQPVITKSAGIAEIIFGVLILVFPNQRWLLGLAMAALAGLLVMSLFSIPSLATAAFNPVTTNVAAIALAWIAYKKRG